VLQGSLSLPRSGLWTAELTVDSAADLDGAVTLSFDDGALSLAGTVLRSGVTRDMLTLLVAGGAGGLSKIARPTFYGATSLRIVLGDLLRTAGETLSPTSSPAVLSHQLNGWTSEAIPIGRLVARLIAEVPGASWRALPDGSIWVGTETWPASTTDFVLMQEEPARGELLLGVDSSPPTPGTVIDLSTTTTPDLRRVSFVAYTVGEPGPRARVFFEDAAPAVGDRLADALAAVVAQAQRPLDYFALYLGRVVAQTGKTIDVAPEDTRLPSMGRVPLLMGVPGWDATIPAGGRVLVGWSGGDPARPYALGFDGETTLTQLTLGGAGAQAAALGTALKAHLEALKTWADTLILPSGGGPAGPPTVPSPSVPDIESEVLKVR
jgi:hypothetical protein